MGFVAGDDGDAVDVGVAQGAAVVVVVVFRIEKIAEKALLPKFFGVLVHFHERVVLQKVIDLAGFLDGLDEPYRICKGIE